MYTDYIAVVVYMCMICLMYVRVGICELVCVSMCVWVWVC